VYKWLLQEQFPLLLSAKCQGEVAAWTPTRGVSTYQGESKAQLTGGQFRHLQIKRRLAPAHIAYNSVQCS